MSVTVRRISWTNVCPTENCSKWSPAICSPLLISQGGTGDLSRQDFLVSHLFSIVLSDRTQVYDIEETRMNARTNRQVRLVARPRGIPQAEHFALVTGPVAAPGEGQIL